MRDYADEAYLHARIYAMRSRLLSLADYAALAGNPGEPLSDKMDGVPDPVVRGEIVFREQIACILPFVESNETYAPLFLAFLRQFEVLNAKLIGAKAFGFQTLEQWYDIEPYAVLRRSMLEEGADLQKIRKQLAGTYLAGVLDDVSRYEQLESRVDLCVVKILDDAATLFPRPAKRDFQTLIKKRIAVTSTILVLRLKKTYQWDDEKIRSFLENFHNAFGGMIWPQMRVVEDGLDRHLEGLRAAGAKEPSVEDGEHYLEQYFFNWISSMFHRDFYSIFCVAAYLWLLYYQIRNLFKIMEGRRFGYVPEHMMAGIVCNK